MAHALAGEVVALAARASSLRRELGGVDRTLLATRAQELGAAARGTRDAAAADDFARAARAAEELGAHVASLDAAADRVRARLALQVVTLETAAFAFVNHRASAVADDALALGPLCERLADASAALRAEAAALDELSAFAPNPAGRAVA